VLLLPLVVHWHCCCWSATRRCFKPMTGTYTQRCDEQSRKRLRDKTREHAVHSEQHVGVNIELDLQLDIGVEQLVEQHFVIDVDWLVEQHFVVDG
jgi:hypothetical protein